MKNYTKEKIEIEKEVVSSVTCDQCNRIIEEVKGELYFEVTTGHRNWGNDSHESVKQLDLCSISCLEDNMSEYYTMPVRETYYYDVEVVKKEG